ncbi:hypothetical protein OGAPHI_003501 [Ogataea philodendri]|uniref:Protein STB3 n=1 Tax=Ogataea philodendri TaxID=1378263 RepID=A0A9P8P7L3_9ASCO|nr:uncharacterized protein OGAPHI_003501 [Ogataea philodendri]KAH3666505.1 hypothetical protein OGAPHI_003501 [Ogataea philodendri]
MLQSLINTTDESGTVKREFSSPPHSSIASTTSSTSNTSPDFHENGSNQRMTHPKQELTDHPSQVGSVLGADVDEDEEQLHNSHVTHTNGKQHRKSWKKNVAEEHKSLISTSSPEGIAAASQITPNRIANILLQEGPLPIRHLTAHLVSQIPSFGHLSLSKQRRLIMAALEMGDSQTGCVFEKIGWGQWEARKATDEQISQRNTQASTSNRDRSPESPPAHSGGAKPKRKEKRGSSVALSTSPKSKGNLPNYRRESITNSATDLHNTKVPLSPSLQPLQSLRNSFKDRKYSLDEAIESSSEEEDDDDSLERFQGEDDDGMFAFEGETTSQKTKHALRNGSFSSTNRRPSFAGIAKPRKPRSSFNSQSIEAVFDENSNLDSASMPDGLLPKRRPRVSFSNSSSVTRQSFLRTNISPSSGPIMMHDQVSNVTINTVSSTENLQDPERNDLDNFTDEEDWEAMGPATLRKNSSSTVTVPATNVTVDHNSPRPISVKVVKPDKSSPLKAGSAIQSDEEIAAIALMDLKSV